MRVLVTGHLGYIGTALVPRMLAAGLDVFGVDSDLYCRCNYAGQPTAIDFLGKDIRDLQRSDLTGFDAVIHLAGLSNDPLGELNPELTAQINYRATVRLARLAKEAGVCRFVFSSSCSTYGAAGEEYVTEEQAFNPVTAYGHSKVMAEKALSRLADSSFCPVYLRNATVYGYSPRMRFDLVVNNLIAWAHTTGKVMLKSQGLAWRPLVHVEDVADAFIAALSADTGDVHNQAFNIGATDENYRVMELAEKIVAEVPGAQLEMAQGAEADERTYRVNCDKALKYLGDWQPAWNLERGIQQLYQIYQRHSLALDEFEGARYQRVAHLQALLAMNVVTPDLRVRGSELIVGRR